MSEKEKSQSSKILEALDSLEAAKGSAYVKGLVDGINLGTARPGTENESDAGQEATTPPERGQSK